MPRFHAPLRLLFQILQHLVDQRVHIIRRLGARAVREARQCAGKIELVHAFKIEAVIKVPSLQGPLRRRQTSSQALFLRIGYLEIELFSNGCDSA